MKRERERKREEERERDEERETREKLERKSEKSTGVFLFVFQPQL